MASRRSTPANRIDTVGPARSNGLVEHASSKSTAFTTARLAAVRLLLAARLSQDHSGQTGLDTQDADARAWAERNGHDVIAAAADKISGRVSPFDRPISDRG
jgi:hypothetical protein